VVNNDDRCDGIFHFGVYFNHYITMEYQENRNQQKEAGTLVSARERKLFLRSVY